MPNSEKDEEILNKATSLLEHTSEYQTLVSKLKPLVESLYPYKQNKKFSEEVKELQLRFKRSGERMHIFKDDSKVDYDSQLNTLRKAFLFLALFETTVTNLLNCLIFLMIRNHHDFFIQLKRKYAKSLRDLDNSYGVSEKLEFLNLHGFSFLTENINNPLRNKIAHMDFDIEGKGVIVVKNSKYDLQTELIKLEAVLLLTARALGNAGFYNLVNDEN